MKAKTQINFNPILVMLIVAILFTATSCIKEKIKQLSPARNIEGTWITPNDVIIYFASDGCGTFARYNSTPVKMTWQITYVDDSNVDIWILSNYIGSTTQFGSSCGSPASLAFPISLHGVVSSSNLKLTESQMQYSNSGAALGLASVEVGNFHFTTSNLTGTITEKDCPIYCSGYETDADKCILTKK